jgi:hypothetical protein
MGCGSQQEWRNKGDERRSGAQGGWTEVSKSQGVAQTAAVGAGVWKDLRGETWTQGVGIESFGPGRKPPGVMSHGIGVKESWQRNAYFRSDEEFVVISFCTLNVWRIFFV